MKNKFGLFGIIAMMAVIWLSTTGCNQPTNDETPVEVDRMTLSAAITAAQTLLAGTAEAADGDNVATTAFWATAAVRTAFANAITAAQGVHDNAAATQAAITAAVSNLAAAQATFNAARRPGTSVTAVDRTALAIAIAAAQTLLAATAESADGTDVATTAYWATVAARAAFANAITTAQGVHGNVAATQAAITAVASDLATAQTTFTAARRPGTANGAEPFVPVTGVTGVPASVAVGTSHALAGTVAPPNATNQAIIWSIQNAGATGATIAGNLLDTAAVGAVTVRATIIDGLAVGAAHSQDFTIAVMRPVTGITGAPTSAVAGTPLTLTGAVTPSDATNQTIAWSVQNAGATGATIGGDTLDTTAEGTVTVRATVTDGLAIGSPYTRDFAITVWPSENFTITFDLQDMAPADIVGPSLGPSKPSATITVNNPERYDPGSIRWVFNGIQITGSAVSGDHGETLLLRPIIHGDMLGAGTHFLTVEVRVNGVLYGRRIAFSVTM